MDKKRSNDNVANADDKEDRHPCGCTCKNRGRSVSSETRKSISLLLGQTTKTAVINVEVKIAESPAGSRSSYSSPSQAKSGSQTAAKSSEQCEHPDKEDSCFQFTATEELVHSWHLKPHLSVSCRSESSNK